MMLTTLKKKSLMKKNSGTYPKETAADQSCARRQQRALLTADTSSLSLSLAAQEMNKPTAFLSTQSSGAKVEQTVERAPLHYCKTEHVPCLDAGTVMSRRVKTPE